MRCTIADREATIKVRIDTSGGTSRSTSEGGQKSPSFDEGLGTLAAGYYLGGQKSPSTPPINPALIQKLQEWKGTPSEKARLSLGYSRNIYDRDIGRLASVTMAPGKLSNKDLAESVDNLGHEDMGFRLQEHIDARFRPWWKKGKPPVGWAPGFNKQRDASFAAKAAARGNQYGTAWAGTKAIAGTVSEGIATAQAGALSALRIAGQAYLLYKSIDKGTRFAAYGIEYLGTAGNPGGSMAAANFADQTNRWIANAVGMPSTAWRAAQNNAAIATSRAIFGQSPQSGDLLSFQNIWGLERLHNRIERAKETLEKRYAARYFQWNKTTTNGR